ncbi:dihydrolipoamide acetyltransferase family protein [Candidatus Methylomirabilis sp.]|uniref:dihydrolipoamide acetyltransferase family protein n=1 Tax=Candidatus Methylomirabilis sp. TaxID=2032687 RepID=UPI002A62192F|nr:dihydrolipoamide acetyltransferase family protein [Candidatus Methylomirabilis sp.]
MPIEIIMPQMGESIAEGKVVTWLKKVGEPVAKDEPLVAISTDKVDVEIPSPADGVLAQIVVQEGVTALVGAVLAYIGEASHAGAVSPDRPVVGRQEGVQAATPAPEAAAPATHWFSPAVLELAKEHGVNLTQIRGTGADGRVTKKDLLGFIALRAQTAAPPPRAPLEPLPIAEDRILPISSMRKAIAEHMIRSQRTAAHVTQIHEVDMTAIDRYRQVHHDGFLKQIGITLTFLPFVVKAVADGLRAYPLINASFTREGIIVKHAINIGIAVALEEGLIVPVLREADKKSFLTLTKQLADLAVRARDKRLSLEEVHEGTFTVNNFGALGTMIGTPIIVQPQAAILGLGRVVKRPVVIDDAIVIRSMAYLCLSYDHRLIDGAYASAFLNHVRATLEGFDFSIVR